MILSKIIRFIIQLLLDLSPSSIPEEYNELMPQDGSDHITEENEHIESDPNFTSPEPTTTNLTESRYAWVIDPGHTITTPGKRSPILEDGKQLIEAKLNHSIADILCDLLTEHNITHLRTCTLNEWDEKNKREINAGLRERARIANNWNPGKPKLFLSIHHNIGPTPEENPWSERFSGTETLIALNPSTTSENMAIIFQNTIYQGLKTKNRGVKNHNAHVLNKTNMPAIMTEAAFMNNPNECQMMLHPSFPHQEANLLLDSIKSCESNL